ncbi:hypothetical protein E1267_11350 [Nonomuraea longispora]|uniref:Uncharacterized protein n=1 Tax=Nonomuraea longispora TaxID=1848320 RepID=A0A4R4NM17_9ACTN|nr:hypothetical protein [Nonomuraea longispora]TDC08062.1 hypothetical protein E1267_11350 [Nonomuraea longispora]
MDSAHHLARIAQRFPLIPRPRPTYRPLPDRINDIRALARTAAANGSPILLAQAVQAMNKASLIASDCGRPDLARAWCRRQIQLFLDARPLSAQEARYALEPAVNLARLAIRAGDADGAYQQLENLYRAVTAHSDALIDGEPTSFYDLTASADEHRDVAQWLWGVLLADGGRALIGAGRWQQAAQHAERYRGVGRRLLDGRQIVIVARCLAGQPEAARQLLDESTLTDPWERLVALPLGALCRRAGGQPADAEIAEMRQLYLALEPADELIVFHTRLGLAMIDLADGPDQEAAASIAARLVHDILAAGDGYAARDLLAHDACRAALTDAHEQTLIAAVEAAGLSTGAIPAPLIGDLHATVELSEEQITAHFGTRLRPATPSRAGHARRSQR